jgi:hypothetical protein
MAEPSEVGHEEAARIVKRAAENRRIAIQLSEEQMTALLDQWSGDPESPAQITFVVGERRVIELPVASCAYWSDTCCALTVPSREKGDPPPDIPQTGQ